MSGIQVTWENDQPDAVDLMIGAMKGLIVEINGTDYFVFKFDDYVRLVCIPVDSEAVPIGPEVAIGQEEIETIKFY